MSAEAAIREVYIDHTGVTEYKNREGLEALEMLEVALGAFAIEQVDSPEDADAMVILGGDGSFLHSLRRHDFPNIPMTGINTGTLGFFMDILPTEPALQEMVRSLANGEFTSKALPLLEVPIGIEGNSVLALNEVVVRSASLQAFKASLKLGESKSDHFDHFVGDGFIFATPLGSTSYSLSAGGPILHEDIDAYIVTPSNSHVSRNYFSLFAPALVPRGAEAVVTPKEVEKRPIAVSADNLDLSEWFKDENEVRVRLSQDRRLKIVRFEGHDYFSHVSEAFRGKQIAEE